MKKKLYYAIPFVGIPILMMLCDVLDNIKLLQMNLGIIIFLFLVFSVVMGFFSTTHKTFDYLLTVIIPLSFFCCMFIVGFLDKCDLECRFHLYKAVKAVFQPIALQLYFLMAITTFLASFKHFRNIKKIYKNKETS